MPEVITKYPEQALKILKEAHIACGVGKPQQILVHCPKDRFCSLPTGEICVYGIGEIQSTTQFQPLEFALFTFSLPFFAIMTLAFAFGIVSGLFWKKKR